MRNRRQLLKEFLAAEAKTINTPSEIRFSGITAKPVISLESSDVYLTSDDNVIVVDYEEKAARMFPRNKKLQDNPKYKAKINMPFEFINHANCPLPWERN